MIDILELQKKVINEYAKGKKCYEVSELLNIEPSVVSFLLKSADIEIKRGTIEKKPKKVLPMKKIKRLYLDEDYDLVDLAKIFRVSTNTIALRLKEMGVKLKGRKLIADKLDVEKIKRLYWGEKKTSNEIGRIYEVSGQTILLYMRKNNILIREPHYKGKVYKKRY